MSTCKVATYAGIEEVIYLFYRVDSQQRYA